MKSKFSIIILIIILLGAGHYLARANGWYNDFWFVDILLHVAAGMMFGLLWIQLVGRDLNLSSRIGIITAAVTGSFLWELWEFSGWHIIPQMLVYVPTLSDTLGDILSGLAGGVIVFLLQRR